MSATLQEVTSLVPLHARGANKDVAVLFDIDDTSDHVDVGVQTKERFLDASLCLSEVRDLDDLRDFAGANIQLKVKDQQGSEVQFKIKKSTPLRKLMDAYCSRLGLTASQVRFMVDGERISADDTAEKLGLEDEDLIDVAMEQTGGCGC